MGDEIEILDPSIALEGREFHIDFVVKCVVLRIFFREACSSSKDRKTA